MYYYIARNEGKPLPRQVHSWMFSNLVVVSVADSEAVMEKLKGRTLFRKEQLCDQNGLFSRVRVKLRYNALFNS